MILFICYLWATSRYSTNPFANAANMRPDTPPSRRCKKKTAMRKAQNESCRPRHRKDCINMTRLILNRLGISASSSGYRYLECAIDLVQKDRSRLLAVTTALYPAIASCYQVSPASVEHCIRYCLNRCWERGNRELLNQIAGVSLQYRPYAREFIAMLADYDAK